MRSYLLYLNDIKDAIVKIESFTKGMSSSEFSRDTKTIDAIIRNLEIIGEAAKNIPKEVKSRFPDVEWKSISGARDIIAHEYFEVDCEEIWKTVDRDIPKLKKQINEMLRTER